LYKGGWLEGNIEDETQSGMQKDWNVKEKIWQTSLASSFIYPNDPLEFLLYGKNMVN